MLVKVLKKNIDFTSKFNFKCNVCAWSRRMPFFDIKSQMKAKCKQNPNESTLIYSFKEQCFNWKYVRQVWEIFPQNSSSQNSQLEIGLH